MVVIRTLLFLYAESPVHAGGDTSVGGLDLPMQRETGTGLPVIWGQSLKGALRAHARSTWGPTDPRIVALFGDPPPSGPDTAEVKPGTLSVGDAQLAAFPVPTLRETFAWATSPLALGRLRRRAGLVELAGAAPSVSPTATDDTALAASDSWIGDRTVLGPYVLPCETDDAATQWARWLAATALPDGGDFDYFRAKVRRDLIVVGDGVLTALSRECAELTPRIQLHEDRKAVRHGPFHSEYLPAETILAALIEAPDGGTALNDLSSLLAGRVLRVGGDESIGKGLLWCRLTGPGDSP
ncbi:type III-B CRISPR module RAMP protein Cmr4 [Dactylosporangium sp. NPDC049525]|uniref:type III-B CRISPR module RAMP protein Cmr4 n=1 Tax=Dactylosporangium sp. NPDC049525 TaxID=3154730 RepID=UPI0034437825